MKQILNHFNSALLSGNVCNAANVGIEIALFHKNRNGSKRPIANVSKTLTETPRSYSQIRRDFVNCSWCKEILLLSLWSKIYYCNRS